MPGVRIDAALLTAGVTATELAARLDVTPETVSRWRLGRLTLSRSRWVAILAVLGLPLDWKAPRGQAATAKRGRGRPRGVPLR
ncbi:MAG: helix-turn-helix transcriptional regulator [Deltaproteobacteria bacterium]|nr:helix-turn-helix transcriptional regulator [Deltaproteobacteria bacterium]